MIGVPLSGIYITARIEKKIALASKLGGETAIIL